MFAIIDSVIFYDSMIQGYDTMSLPTSKKVNKHHLKCIVCDKSFGAEYDPVLKAYPIYHPRGLISGVCCEDIFYRTLMGVYQFLMGSELSVPANQLLKEASALNDITQKKDFVTWCLARGFLEVDGLHRIDIPHVILEEFERSFSDDALLHLADRDGAVEWIQNKLRFLREDLRPVTPDRMPFKQSELKLGETTLFDNIDTSKVELKRDRKDSSESSGRASSLRSTLERRR